MPENNRCLKSKLLDTKDFVLTFELVPGKTRKGSRVRKLIEFAEQAAAHGGLDALTLTDNPGGNPLLSPDGLGREILKMGMEPIVHVTCRDSNRLGMYSRAQQLDSIGVKNLLVLTGDYPSENDAATAKPCFDLDSFSLMCFLKQMNGSKLSPCMNINVDKREETDFLLGCAVSCMKYNESEQMTQYYKLINKVRNGAKFIITQLGYDARKFHELVQFVSNAGITAPILGSVYILSEPAARFMNQGKVPGVYVSDSMYRKVADEAKSQDKGRGAAIERAARLMAVLHGLGYRGAHIGGHASYPEIKDLIDRYEGIKANWKDYICEFIEDEPESFYLYGKDPGTGLNFPGQIDYPSDGVGARLVYNFYELFHRSSFNREHFLFPMYLAAARSADRHGFSRSLYTSLEHISKKALFDCRMCGDCALAEMAYVCPESKCAKFLRNGPCGGSSDTACEVFPDKQCAWVTVYARLKSVGLKDRLKDTCMPPRNWSLDQTSSWINFYLCRDHHQVDAGTCCSKEGH